MEFDRLWLKICAVFRTDVSEEICDLWLSQLEPVHFAVGELFLTGPDRARAWIELRYLRALNECAALVADHDISIVLLDEDAVATLSNVGSHSNPNTPDAPDCTPLNPRYTFEQFVIGHSNQLGHAATLAVAEQPAQAFNPLFIYGPPGVGKTHLLHAIGNFLRIQAPELRVVYMTAENFASTFRNVVRDGSIGDFKTRLRESDVLLVDDVQFLQNKTKTEEEFFHTFNALHESGRQLVLTCDRRPRQLSALADRLLARFESGLVAEIDEPDHRLRKTILRKRVQLDAVPIDCDSALDRIAERVPANVRSLEGALIRVSAFASLQRRPVTAELVDELLDSLHPRVATRASVADIQRVVADHFDLTLDQLLSSSRESRLAAPRQMAMYLSCELTDDSLPVIAGAFGRNHSTVVHARDKISAAGEQDSDLAATADTLKRLIDSRSTNHGKA